jgi:2-C-methyl-D-erythritol 2,4-cyclodiphosphate synthase
VGEHRVGLGFDVHRTQAGRPLSLAGVVFPNEDGLAGHSDGDAVCHAVADALLGAAAQGDLGAHFPDDDPAIEGLDGLELLTRTVAILATVGWRPQACDATVICERPVISTRREEMRDRLAAALAIDVDRVSVKATRPEGLGLVGEGIGCLAIATIA